MPERVAQSVAQKVTTAYSPLARSSEGQSRGLVLRKLRSPTIGNQTMQHVLKSRTLQAKPNINQPGDRYEQEADRVAETVMRMPGSRGPSGVDIRNRIDRSTQRCTCGASTLGGQCEACRTKNQQLQRSAPDASSTEAASPLVDQVLRSPGQRLDASTRSFMEPRFGRDFGDVRIHTDSLAAESARDVNALAYTVGNHIVFDSGQHAAGRPSGLLAHELSHVIQQDSKTRQSPAPYSLMQRKCNPDGIGHPSCSEVDPAHRFVEGSLFEFQIDCDNFKSGEEGRMTKFAKALDAVSKIEIHGYASVDGPADFNENLACARALKTQAVLAAAIGSDRVVSVTNHGPTPGPAQERRSAVLRVLAGPKPTDGDARSVPTDSTMNTRREGNLPADAPTKDPDVVITPQGTRDVPPKLSTAKTVPGPPSNLIEINAELDASVKLFSTGDNPASADPCRRGEVDTNINMKLKLDGFGVGDRIHLFYHEPQLQLSFAPTPCKSLPELKWEQDFFNIEIVPKILEFSLKPGLTFSEGQLKPGASAEVELKPFGRANNFLSNIKISGEVEVLSEKQEGKTTRGITTEGTFHVGVDF